MRVAFSVEITIKRNNDKITTDTGRFIETTFLIENVKANFSKLTTKQQDLVPQGYRDRQAFKLITEEQLVVATATKNADVIIFNEEEYTVMFVMYRPILSKYESIIVKKI